MNNKPTKKFSKKAYSNEVSIEINDFYERQDVLQKKQYRKISRKKPGQKSENYITEDTQRAIVEYQQTIDLVEKHKIYLEKIYPAFESLADNLINVYGFTTLHETRNDLKNDCISFLYETVQKFDESKGSKAFSYFNVVAKHWFMIRSKTNTKKSKAYLSIDDKDNISQHDFSTIENYNIIPASDELMLGKTYKENLNNMISEIELYVKTDNEKACMKAIKILFNDIDDIDFLNKRAVLLYLKEITTLNPKQLSVVLANLKKIYKQIKAKNEQEIS